jgi:hypothetical protein
MAQAHFALGDYEQAVAHLKERLPHNPTSDVTHVLLAACYGHLAGSRRRTRRGGRRSGPIRRTRSNTGARSCPTSTPLTSTAWWLGYARLAWLALAVKGDDKLKTGSVLVAKLGG